MKIIRFATRLFILVGLVVFANGSSFTDNSSSKSTINTNNIFKKASNFRSGEVEKAGLFNSLVDKELSIVLAILGMIEDRGVVPTTIQELKDNKYLANNFNDNNNLFGDLSKKITFEVKNNVIEINTNIDSSDDVTVAEKEYYLNNTYNSNNISNSLNLSIDKKQVVSTSNTLQTNYYINRKNVNILETKKYYNMYGVTNFVGSQEPSTYSVVNNGDIWFDSNVKEFDFKLRTDNEWVDTANSNKNLNEDGTFLNNNPFNVTAVIKKFTNVNITEEEKVIECRTAGATYNQVLNRCEAFTSDACDGGTYNPATDGCVTKATDYCANKGYDGYDDAVNACFNYYHQYENAYWGTLMSDKYLTVKQEIAYTMKSSWHRCSASPHSSLPYTSDGYEYMSPTYDGHYHEGQYATAQRYDVNNICENSHLYPYTWFDGWACRGGSSGIGNSWQDARERPRSEQLLLGNGQYAVTDACQYYNNVHSYECPSGWTEISASRFNSCKTEAWLCPTSGFGYIGNEQCRKTSKNYIVYFTNGGSYDGYIFAPNSIGGQDGLSKTPSCVGKKMTVIPQGYSNFLDTPTYGNNGICYSDVGLYCKTYAGSTQKILLPNDKQIVCWDTTQTCNDARFGLATNYSGNSDKCSKFNYSCNDITRYGLAERPHPQNILPNPYVGASGFDNPTVLFDRITDKFNKVLIPSNLDKIVAKEDILIDDNQGAMCVENIESKYTPSSTDYEVLGKPKSGF